MSQQQEMITDLLETLSISNIHWTQWERDFISSLRGKKYFDLSNKQKLIIVNLWERI